MVQPQRAVRNAFVNSAKPPRHTSTLQLLTRGCGRVSAGPARVGLASLSRRRFHGGFHAYLLLLIRGDHSPIARAQQNR